MFEFRCVTSKLSQLEHGSGARGDRLEAVV
jgi:hypothetical protein